MRKKSRAKLCLQLYDEFAGEPYNLRNGKPHGMLRCSYCNEYWEPDTYETILASGYSHMITVCKHCGEVSFQYEEE